MTSKAFTVTAAAQNLQPMLIPSAWIIDGQPLARVCELNRSRDGTTVTSAWDCTAGTFFWRFDIDETVHIVEGEVFVSEPGGSETRLGPGDKALFHAGHWGHWRVPNYVRKVAICRVTVPVAVGLLPRLVNRMRSAWYARTAPASIAVVMADEVGALSYKSAQMLGAVMTLPI